MKALEKDRNRRYETVSGLAADVRRYLDDEPVQACPPSAWYRITKSARRNRVALVTSTLVTSALLLGTAVSAWQAVRATRAERQVAAAFNVADSQRRMAEERSRLARQAVDEMYSEFATNVLAAQPGMKLVQRRFLEKALALYERFARQQGNDPEVRFGVASAYRRMSGIQRELGQKAQAEAAIRRAVRLSEELVADLPGVSKYRELLAGCYNTMGVFLSDPREKERAFRVTRHQV
jgi:tetratricopeptide (TPR) repeat protein